MICLDTTYLVDLWRNRLDPDHAAVVLLARHGGEVFAVPASSAGEFLEGAASISEQRLQESLAFLRMFELGTITVDTAVVYARIVADLRRRGLLAGSSRADLWNAAYAMERRASLVTRNVKHFAKVSGLQLIAY
ncbi:MAG: type II toxin-antitoxin system VapC family toxin [Deltaproteobacteria bacterium]|nr:type II toxin-antitoxin system VapC family toxin [Deltaproteobacteria bacterium]